MTRDAYGTGEDGTDKDRIDKDQIDKDGIGKDRLLAFADAVTAIAITLLALEIRVPEGLDAGQLGHALGETLVKVYAYLLSFTVVGLLWLAHHRLFSLMVAVDRATVRLELALLAVIAALPFPTRLLSEYGGTTEATAGYAAAIALTAALLTVMTLRLRASGPPRIGEASPRRVARLLYANATLTAVFATSIPVALASPTAAKYWWGLLVPLRILPRWVRRWRRIPD
ncbi:TMEM175 family protein [Streptomyces griseocarneus]|uniref:TMEM175 family protein n=1 Tax=Streptomyces griseocarneus TaxID=51201 RepID=UPI0019C20B5D|nr:TMEM175 family protein [Streptomyces griseocarneus]MBZ6475543.1 DUF1211 domain-containing protein [Streptomyces griseocarneus]GHG69695.1 DUF1211 domain-containing membrane protein [Streptomyces griseocarneus]